MLLCGCRLRIRSFAVKDAAAGHNVFYYKIGVIYVKKNGSGPCGFIFDIVYGGSLRCEKFAGERPRLL